MDFLKLLRSFEDLLFELLTWLIYYPRTIWLVLRHPVSMIDQSRHEEVDDPGDRYEDTLSPPLLLLLTVVFLHGIEMSRRVPSPARTTEVMRLILESDQNLIVVRSLVFGLLPLSAAVIQVRAQGLALTRPNLRAPFFGQCYPTSVYALSVSAATMLGQVGGLGWGAAALALAASAWYLAIGTVHFHRVVPASPPRALALAVAAFVMALAYALGVLIVLAGGL